MPHATYTTRQVHHDQNSAPFTPQGARLYTFFLYLNTPEAGGGTRFNDLDITVDLGPVGQDDAGRQTT